MKQIAFLFLVSILLFSCTEKTQVNVVSGRLFEECDVPLANREIALKANQGGSFNNTIILGSAVSNTDGTFNFTYELEEEASGSGDILLINTNGFKVLLSDLSLNEDAALSLYNKDSADVNIVLEGSRTFTSTDTLFFGLNQTGNQFSVINPSNGALVDLKTTINRSLEDNTPVQVYYGLGKTEFELAKKATGEEGALRNITLNIGPCMLTDTARIVIN